MPLPLRQGFLFYLSIVCMKSIILIVVACCLQGVLYAQSDIAGVYVNTYSPKGIEPVEERVILNSDHTFNYEFKQGTTAGKAWGKYLLMDNVIVFKYQYLNNEDSAATVTEISDPDSIANMKFRPFYRPDTMYFKGNRLHHVVESVPANRLFYKTDWYRKYNLRKLIRESR